MQVTDEYLSEFAVTKIEPPKKIKFNGWEMDTNASITLDDSEHHTLAYMYWDDWPSPKGWKHDGPENRWTKVVVQKNGETLGDEFYEFEGLVPYDLLRTWFRDHLKLKDPE